MPERLNDYFTGAAAKTLRAVEVSRERSNQHEIDGVASIKAILGSTRQHFQAQFIYFGESEDETVACEAPVTWYDAREAHPTRSEHRLYFQESEVMDLATEGDLLLVALMKDGGLIVVVAQQGSTFESQLVWLFGLEKTDLFDVRKIPDDIEVGLARGILLTELGIEPDLTEPAYLDDLLHTFGSDFPRTKAFSEFARTYVDCDAVHEPDSALTEWLSMEEVLFRTLEEHIVGKRIREGFAEVDDFISFSLSVHNRRKSRAGYALENHLEAIFIAHSIGFDRTPNTVTENGATPDFLFPGVAQYHQPHFPASKLAMLASKNSCKERWAQALAEASRIKRKHLITLEPGISEHQTDAMEARNLQLVIPKDLHGSYSDRQKMWILSLYDFVDMVKERQRK